MRDHVFSVRNATRGFDVYTQLRRKHLFMRTTIALFLFLMPSISASSPDVAQQKMDELFATYNNPRSPGCSVGVIRDGSFIFRKSYGEASLELGAPLTSQSVFYMASVSKQFTAASIVLAAEQGFLSLDDDVRKYIPELPDYGRPITLRQMLHQTSGFRDFLALTYLSGRGTSALSSPDSVLKLIARQKGLNNAPGEEFVYSNSNYFLLGVVIKRATGKSLAEFSRANIFQPLGMTHTLFYDDNTVVVPNRVAAYDPGKDGKFLVDWSTLFDSRERRANEQCGRPHPVGSELLLQPGWERNACQGTRKSWRFEQRPPDQLRTGALAE